MRFRQTLKVATRAKRTLAWLFCFSAVSVSAFAQTIEIDLGARSGLFQTNFADRMLKSDSLIYPSAGGGALPGAGAGIPGGLIIGEHNQGYASAAIAGLRYVHPFRFGDLYLAGNYMSYGRSFQNLSSPYGTTAYIITGSANSGIGAQPSTNNENFVTTEYELGSRLKIIADVLTLVPHAGIRSIDDSFIANDPRFALTTSSGFSEIGAGPFAIHERVKSPTYGAGFTIGIARYFRLLADYTYMHKVDSHLQFLVTTVAHENTGAANPVTVDFLGLNYRITSYTMRGSSYTAGFEIGKTDGFRVRLAYQRDEYLTAYPGYTTVFLADYSAQTTSSGATITGIATGSLPTPGMLSQWYFYGKEQRMKLGTYSLLFTIPIHLTSGN